MSDSVLEAAGRFHGHVGPWLALGLRAGGHAVRALRAGPFRIDAEVHCPGRTPYTCFLDGVQFASGCTMGKGNIRQVRSRRCWVEFRKRRQRGESTSTRGRGPAIARLRLEVRPELWTELHLGATRTRVEVETLGRAIFRRKFRKLFLESRPA